MSEAPGVTLDTAGAAQAAQRPRAFTSRVVSAGMWSLGAQAATTVASLIATPFGIRALDTELYGVLTLVNMVIGYAAFADLALGQASTKFAAEQHARGSAEGEADVVWTSLALVLAASGVVALVMFAAAPLIMRRLFALPAHLVPVGTTALRVAVIGFVAKNVAGVLNTAALVRLRVKLDISINTIPLVLQILLVPVVLWLGGSLVAAVVVMVSASCAIALLHGVAGMVLLPELRRPRFRRALVRPLLRFGSHLVAASLVGLVMFSLDRVLLVRLDSVSVVAYYTVAMTLANIVSIAPVGMMNPLLSSFSQLRALSQRAQLDELYSRILRLILLGTVPLVVWLCAFARPFLALWAGAAYGRESTRPFCFLVLGTTAMLITRTAKELLKAHGTTGVFVRFYLIELLPYAALAAACIVAFGPTGAAIAFSTRALADAVLVVRAATAASGIPFQPLRGTLGRYVICVAVGAAPLAGAVWAHTIAQHVAVGALLVASTIAYALLARRLVLTEGERAWIARVAGERLGRRAQTPAR